MRNQYQQELDAELTQEALWERFEESIESHDLHQADEIITLATRYGFDLLADKMVEVYKFND